jgi:hypothetical protein
MWVEDGILHFYFNLNAEINLEIAKDFVRRRKELCEGKPHPAIVNSTGLKWASREARAYLASPESTESIKITAFVVNGTVQKIFTGFFLTFYKPPVPVKVFNDTGKAIAWLKSFAV